jgi:hypothetical protein
MPRVPHSAGTRRKLAAHGTHMALTDKQIERYSRQIIVPGVGGRAQERLLTSCLALIAEPADAASALAYLAGAGVGRILVYPIGGSAAYGEIIERLRDLNPEANIRIAGGEPSQESCGLMLALIGDARAAETAARIWRTRHDDGVTHYHGVQGSHTRDIDSAVIARFDTPGRIALLPAPPPCPLCVDVEMLNSPGGRAANAGAIAMVAVTEAFKLLAGFAAERTPGAELIEFDGCTCVPRALGRRPNSGDQARCTCETPLP